MSTRTASGPGVLSVAAANGAAGRRPTRRIRAAIAALALSATVPAVALTAAPAHARALPGIDQGDGG